MIAQSSDSLINKLEECVREVGLRIDRAKRIDWISPDPVGITLLQEMERKIKDAYELAIRWHSHK